MSSSERAILGIAVRAFWTGFAILGANGTLVDWGMVFYRPADTDKQRAAKRRLEWLFEHCVLSHVALGISKVRTNRESPGVRAIQRAIRSFASIRSISVVPISRNQIRDTFREFGNTTKDDIVAILVRLFPELAPQAPPKRAIWEKEHYRSALFDALAAAITFSRSGNESV